MEGFLHPLSTALSHCDGDGEVRRIEVGCSEEQQQSVDACSLQGRAQYSLRLAPYGEPLCLNEQVGREMTLEFLGKKGCVACGKSIRKTFSGGYCNSCFYALAAADLCMVKPETCHFARGSCREPRWGVAHCMIPHTVYLAISSDLKVGITRRHQKIHRWISQGAVQAVELGSTRARIHAGIIEVALKRRFRDRTDPRVMLTSTPPFQDLVSLRREVLEEEDFGVDFEASHEGDVRIHYPVTHHSSSSLQLLNLDRHPTVKGILQGIKGQYLLLESGMAFNVKKHAGYEVSVSFASG